jgi:hypothetical protein
VVLCYVPVSFAIGLVAAQSPFSLWQAVLFPYSPTWEASSRSAFSGSPWDSRPVPVLSAMLVSDLLVRDGRCHFA